MTQSYQYNAFWQDGRWYPCMWGALPRRSTKGHTVLALTWSKSREFPLLSACVLWVLNCSCRCPVGGDVAVRAARMASIIHLVSVRAEWQLCLHSCYQGGSCLWQGYTLSPLLLRYTVCNSLGQQGLSYFKCSEIFLPSTELMEVCVLFSLCT